MRPGRSCSTCVKNQKNKCVFTFTGMDACTRGRQALGQLKRTHQHVIQDFIKSLKPKIKNKFANKFAEGRFQPRTLDHAFSLALNLEKKIQIADSFRMTSWIAGLLQWLMRSRSHPLDETRAINEISSNSSYRNNNSKGNYNSKSWHQKSNNKPWQNREQQTLQNKG